MEEENLIERLEGLLKENPKLTKHSNWDTDMLGIHGYYKMYILMFHDHSDSTHLVLVKNYLNGRLKGKYSVLTEGEQDSNSIKEVMDKINDFYKRKTQHL